MSELVNKKPRRRWLQFSVRTFLLAVAIFAVWLGFHVRSARRQQAAVAAILQDEGRVSYDFEVASGHARDAKPSVPNWLLSRLGVDYFHDVVSVELLLSTGDDRERTLEHLEALPGLERLDLFHLPSELAVQRIGRLDRLESLVVMDATTITGETMQHIARLRRLKTLAFAEAVNLTDAGVAQLVSLRQLEALHVGHAKLSDESLRVVAGLPQLKNLSIIMCGNITDDGLVHLAELPNLEVLDLSGTAVTNEGLEVLKGLKNLKSLTVVNTRVNDASGLQKALPNCAIDFAPRYPPMPPPD